MARIAVTGATGFIGRHAVALLVQGDGEVRALVRSHADGQLPQGVHAVQGDVRDAAAVDSLVQGCDVVIHLAGGFSDRDDVEATVVEGTANVLAAASRAAVKRLVHMSCLPANASSETPYYSAKWRAEASVRGSDVPFTILRPSLVVGRGDGLLEPLAALIRSLPVTPVPGAGNVRYQPVDVDDLARCIQIATTSADLENVEVSVGGPVYVTFRQLVDLISDRLGVAKPKVRIPVRFLPTIAQAIPSGSRPLFSSPRLEQLQQMSVASHGIVPRMFGFEPASMVPKLSKYLA